MRIPPSSLMAASFAALAANALGQFAAEELPQVGYHVAGVHYYTSPYLANALATEDRNWVAVRPKPGGESWETIEENPQSGQVDSLGNPRFIASGQSYLKAHPGQNSSESAIFGGRVVLVWQGNADIRVANGTFLSNGQNATGQPQSNGPATGSLTSGTRVYDMGASPNGIEVRVYAADSGNYPRNIRLWLAHPDTGASLINQAFHPRLLARVADRPWTYIRFMDWGPTNANPQKDWPDRRLPHHTFQAGILNPRDPSEGAVWYYDKGQPIYFQGNRGTGVAFEHMVALANATNKHMWVCVPHLATDDFVTKMAQVIRFGSDANGTPYTSTQSNPVYPPLNSGLKVYLEYSNEIWSNGNSFPQGNWAQERANALGISRPKFNARRFAQVWRLFQNVFGSSNRLVKVAAVFTGNETYTTEFLNELRAYGPTLGPAQEPDIISPTTYFGNGIQDWAHQRAISQAPKSDSWFYTTQTFDHDKDASTPPRPVSKPISDAYWSSTAFARHLNETFDEWERRQLSGSSMQGGGFDTTGEGGGFPLWLRNLAQTIFPTPKPLVAYEGGPSLYTDYLDSGDIRDDGVTHFINALNRHARMRDAYRIHLNLAKAKGLWSHMMFVDVSEWGKFGQWGHLESLLQQPSQSVKYQFILDWVTEASSLRHIDRPSGAVPTFTRDPQLPQAFVGVPYSETIGTGGGNGTRTTVIIGRSLSPGLNASISGNSLVINGTPNGTGSSFVFARVRDGDGDPAWRIFSVRSVQRSTDPPVTVNFEAQTVTGTASTPEPLDVSGYRFRSRGNSQGTALSIQGTGSGWDEGWASKVLSSNFWGAYHHIARTDGRTFDLYDLDVASPSATSVKITGYAPGGITMERIFNISAQKQPMTKLLLDWITVTDVEIRWYELANAQGGNRLGALDNIRFNTGTGGGGGGGSGGGGGGGSPDGNPGAGQGSGSITRDLWTDVPGTGIAGIPVGTAPASTGSLTSFEAPSNAGDNYGQRVEGYLHPSASGNYTFWISGDDSVELWLSSNDQPTFLQRIAYHNGWTGIREWNKYTTQKSSPITLVAGQRYYIRALMKEGNGGDSLAVSWRLNSTNPANGDGTFIIPGSALAPRSAGGGGGSAPTAPSGLTATAPSSSQINLSWTDNANNETAYKVERATSSSGPWTEIAGSLAANTTSYSATGLTASTTYHFRVRASNANGNSAYSNTANATTPANSGGGGSPTNLSLNKPASASTTETGNTPNRANDGNTGTRWAASSGSFPQWWEVDLGSAHDVSSSEIIFEGVSVWRYRIDGRATTTDAWTTLVDRTANATNSHTYTDTLASGANKRYIRVTITGYNGGYWWASMWECRILGVPSSGGATGSILREVWNGISGTTVSAIPVGTQPSSSANLTSFEAPSNVADNYGQRIRGFITPTTSGNYTFWIAADDNCELWLSTNGNPANRMRIAFHNDWTNIRQWGKHASQRSSPITLTAGARYYIEALMKEGGGGDHLAVAWRLNNTATPADDDGSFIIPGAVLSLP